MKLETLELIDKLTSCWSNWDAEEKYYLTELAPSIVRLGASARLMDNEKVIVAQLRDELSDEDWLRLPALIAESRGQQEEKRRIEHERELKNRENLKQRQREKQEARKQLERRQREEMEARKQLERRQRDEEEEQNKLEQRQRKEQEAGKRQFIVRIENTFERDFLSADFFRAGDPGGNLISDEEYAELKTSFVRDWVLREIPQHPLDPEQAAAVGATAGNVLVVARAGSGKTRTLVTKAIFLQRHCRIVPDQLLLLAFNKKAAEEMKGRLAKVLGTELPHVMTFHALAHALVHPEEQLVFDDSSADQLGLSREIQEVIDEYARSEEYGACVRDLMLSHFREDWERIVNGRFELRMEEFLSHRRNLPRESLKGDFVKSFGEKVIANALFEYGVDYHYERNFRWNGVNYRPDFTIPVSPKGGIIIEYFGLEGDPDYDEMSKDKRKFWAEQKEWKLIEFSPADLTNRGVDSFVQSLLQKLAVAGVECQRLNEEEIWELVKRRALDHFTGAMKNFVARCRKQNLSPDDLRSIIIEHTPCSIAEELFLNLGVPIYGSYLQRLVISKKEDFDGLMWRSVSLVKKGQTRFNRDKGRERGDIAKLKYVLIDEFQDFSQMFFELVDAIRCTNPSVRFFCVGDDWQAINAFAGSELKFFTEFERCFHNTSRYYVRNNYRSPVSIVEAGNALMHGRGMGANPARREEGLVQLCRVDKFSPSAPEQERHNGDEITPALLRLIRNFLDSGMDVVLLSRRNGVPWYVRYRESVGTKSNKLVRFQEHIRSYLPENDRGRVTVSTAHGYKGIEQSAVVVLDAVKRSYPLIHPNWAFLRVFGDSIGRIDEEERRLFYVAVTRAKKSLALVTEISAESQYLGDIREHVGLMELHWANLPPAPSLDGSRLEIRVSNAYDVKDQLISIGYHWVQTGKYWRKAAMAESFSFDTLVNQAWANSKVKIEVYSEKNELIHSR